MNRKVTQVLLSISLASFISCAPSIKSTLERTKVIITFAGSANNHYIKLIYMYQPLMISQYEPRHDVMKIQHHIQCLLMWEHCIHWASTFQALFKPYFYRQKRCFTLRIARQETPSLIRALFLLMSAYRLIETKI